MDKEILEHESYGLVEFARVHHTPKMMFGSNVPCSNGIKLTIRKGCCERDSFRERFNEDSSTLIEIEMTANQFSELITHMNCEPGIPCTIIQKDGVYLEQKPFLRRVESIRKLFKQRFKDKFADFIKTANEAKYKLTKTSLSKNEQQELVSTVTQLANEYEINIPYFMEQFDGTMDNLSVEAKSEFESWLAKRVINAGIRHINDNMESITKITNDEELHNIIE